MLEDRNPAIRARMLAKFQESSHPSEMIGPNEQTSIERVKSAISRYSDLRHWDELYSGNR